MMRCNPYDLAEEVLIEASRLQRAASEGALAAVLTRAHSLWQEPSNVDPMGEVIHSSRIEIFCNNS